MTFFLSNVSPSSWALEHCPHHHATFSEIDRVRGRPSQPAQPCLDSGHCAAPQPAHPRRTVPRLLCGRREERSEGQARLQETWADWREASAPTQLCAPRPASHLSIDGGHGRPTQCLTGSPQAQGRHPGWAAREQSLSGQGMARQQRSAWGAEWEPPHPSFCPHRAPSLQQPPISNL